MTTLSTQDDPRAGVPWQTIANWVFVGFMVLAGYIWNQTISDLRQTQTTNATQTVDIARLQEWRIAQEESNGRLTKQLDDINRKLDRLLLMPAASRPTFQRGGQFDK